MTLDKAIQVLIERKGFNKQLIGNDKGSDFSKFSQEHSEAIDVVLKALGRENENL